ncbi:unnamed protein product [Agarophyton chilense]
MGDQPPTPTTAAAMTHLGHDIQFDALAATHELNHLAHSVTSREESIPVDLVWRNLTFDVPLPRSKKRQKAVVQLKQSDAELPSGVAPLKPNMRRILHAVSGQVRSGHVLAIMGASGSGKTTMLNMLSGRLKSSSKCITGGSVYVNGQSRNFSTFPHIAKFVEQDDTTMFAELTVREQILFAARLALSDKVPEVRKKARVEKIIQELGLSKCSDTYIGNELTRGVSGGERRRVAIGVELVTDPSLIFLDEPTTGLDSFNALNVMSSLRHLARNGRTIITTIHQPRSSIFHLFDMLCLISEGRTIYFGPAADVVHYFDTLGFHCPPRFNVADFCIDVLSIDHRSEEREHKTVARIEYMCDHYRQNVEPQLLCSADAYQAAHSMQPTANTAKFGNGVLKEFSILVRRTSKLMLRERQLNMTRLAQTLLFAVLLGLIWLNSGRDSERSAVEGVLFFVVVNQCFDSAFGVVFAYPKERAIVNRERASGFYRDVSYFFGKQLCELPRAAGFNLLLLLILYFMVGLRESGGAFFTLLLITVVVSLAGEGMAQALSVFGGDEQTAAAIVPVAVIFQLLFGGFFIQPNALPGYIAWMRWATFMYYAFNAAVLNEFGDNPFGSAQGFTLSKWESIGVLIAFAVGFKLLYFLALRANKPRFDRTL